MRPSLIYLLFILMGATSLHAREDTSGAEARWKRAQQQLQSGRAWVAERTETRVDVYDGKGVFLGATLTTRQLTGWGKDNPIRKEIASQTKGSPGLTMELSFGFENEPYDSLGGFSTFTDKGVVQMDGTAAMRVDATGTSDGKPMQATAYLEPASDKPIKVDYILPVGTTFGRTSAHVSVRFGASKEGAWVPMKVDIDESGRYLFWKRRLVIHQDFLSWVKRP